MPHILWAPIWSSSYQWTLKGKSGFGHCLDTVFIDNKPEFLQHFLCIPWRNNIKWKFPEADQHNCNLVLKHSTIMSAGCLVPYRWWLPLMSFHLYSYIYIVTCLERYFHGNEITLGHCVGIAESTNAFPQRWNVRCVTANCWIRCPLSCSINPYIMKFSFRR